MPRQLPWVRAAPKQQPRPTKPSKVASDIDDGFFDRTILAVDKKGKRRAVSPGEHSESSNHATCNARKRRALSSSPPLPELSAPRIENMRGAVSRFELRDDEWMMVEDELLDTAKLFTRHLHIAEYERIKKGIEEKKRGIDANQAAVRPVVSGATFSAEGAIKEKARIQNEKQRRAFHDVFALQDQTLEPTALALTKAVEKSPVVCNIGDTDSEDLDASPRPQRFTASRHTAVNSASSIPPISHTSDCQNSSIAKASLVPHKTASRINTLSAQRTTPFDMLDEYLPGSNHLAPAVTRNRHKEPELSTTEDSPKETSNEKPPRAPVTHRKPRQSMQLLDEWDAENPQSNTEVDKGALSRLGKGKKERGKMGSGKRKDGHLDDVPTFLL